MTETIRAAVGLLFLAAGVSKLQRPRSIWLTVERYRLLPIPLVGTVAFLLGPTEAAVGCGLMVSAWFPAIRVVWMGAAALLAVFTLAIASALSRGMNIPCGCGVLLGDHEITWLTLFRNLILLLVLYLSR
jgi:hypothetical protein